MLVDTHVLTALECIGLALVVLLGWWMWDVIQKDLEKERRRKNDKGPPY